MSNNKIWLSSPHMGGNEMKYVQDAYDTNWVAPLGPNVNGFEKDLQNYTGAKHAAALSAGTAAIHLALILLDVKAGDEILASSFTFSATINPIKYQGAIPILIDSEVETWNMCPLALEEAIIDRIAKGNKPKAIISVYLYGMPGKVEALMTVANKYDIPMIEDAAEALGSTYKGKAMGTFGKFGILSFNGNKIITTSAGGALISDDKAMIDKSRFLATQARDDAPHYQHSEVGYNYRMSNIVAGIGRGQMEVLGERVSQRRANFIFYKELFETIAGVTLLEEPNSDYFSNFWLTAILVDPSQTNGVTREDIRLALEKENIECRPLWKPMHLQPVFADCPYYGTGVSEELFDRGLCLPSGSNLTSEDKLRIKNALLHVLKHKETV